MAIKNSKKIFVVSVPLCENNLGIGVGFEQQYFSLWSLCAPCEIIFLGGDEFPALDISEKVCNIGLVCNSYIFGTVTVEEVIWKKSIL